MAIFDKVKFLKVALVLCAVLAILMPGAFAAEYDAADVTAPSITFILPTNGTNVSQTSLLGGLSFIVNGTGSNVSYVFAYLVTAASDMSWDFNQSIGPTGSLIDPNCSVVGDNYTLICHPAYTADYGAGASDLYVQVFDYGTAAPGLQSNATIDFFIDNTTPTLNVTIFELNNTGDVLADGSWTNENIYLEITCDDGAGAGCDWIKFCVADSIGGCNLSHGWDRSNGTDAEVLFYDYDPEDIILKNGTRFIGVWANDTVGHNTTVTYYSVIIDRVAPVMNITAPANLTSSTINQYVYFTATDDNATSSCWWRRSGSDLNTTVACALGVVEQSWTVGTHTVFLTVMDQAGNTHEDTVTFTKEATTSGGGSSGGGGGGGGSYGFYTATYVADHTKAAGESGFSRRLGLRQQMRIKVGSENHYIGVVEISASQLRINVSSETQQALMKPGETVRFEVTGDNIYDLSVKLNSISGGNGNFTVWLIDDVMEAVSAEPPKEAEPVKEAVEEEPEPEVVTSEPVPCVPDWQCSEWGQCMSGEKTRVCEDANKCGIETSKPVVTEKCGVAQGLLVPIILGILLVVIIAAVAMYLHHKKMGDD